MEQPNEIKFSVRQTYLEFVNVVLLNSTLLNYFDKIDILGFHKLMYAGLLIGCKTIFNILKTVGNIDIISILLKDDIKNHLASQNSNILSYFEMIIKNTNFKNTYVDMYFDSIIQFIKPVFDTMKMNDLYLGDKYKNVFKNHKENINDENIYDKFVELVALFCCDSCILYYNYMYDYVFDNRGRIKNMHLFNDILTHAIKIVDKLINTINTYSVDDNYSLSGDDNYSLSGDDNYSLSGDDNNSLSGDDNNSLLGNDNNSLLGNDNNSLLGDDISDIDDNQTISSDSSMCDSDFSKQFYERLNKTIGKVLSEKIVDIETNENNEILI